MTETRIYAFWRHDSFPYTLGGEITKIYADGSVETAEFGRGFRFKPFLLLPLNAGKRLAEKLKLLRAQELTARKKHDRTWAKAAKDTLDAASAADEINLRGVHNWPATRTDMASRRR